MFAIKRAQFIVIASTLLYVFMIVMNGLAVLLPINGVSTQEISARYDTLFAPAGLTFSIWAVIYLFLGFEVLMNIIKISQITDSEYYRIKCKSNIILALTSLINGLWIVFWHYELLLVSLILMVILFGLLAYVNIALKKAILIDRLPYSLYFGWITIALIANVASYIVGFGIQFNSVGAVLQTSIIILIASLVAGLTIYLQKDYAYGIVIIWSLIGILIRHIDPNQFDRAYISVANFAIAGIVICSLMLIVTAINQIFLSKKNKSIF